MQALLKRHEALMADVLAFRTTIDSLSEQATSCKVFLFPFKSILI